MADLETNEQTKEEKSSNIGSELTSAALRIGKRDYISGCMIQDIYKNDYPKLQIKGGILPLLGCS